MSDQISPAAAKLLAAADEVLAMAKHFQADDRLGDAIACAMFANEYVRAARAMQDMEDASKAYDQQKGRDERKAPDA
jgi:c-di-AMP phosphodiesterase-like protein